MSLRRDRHAAKQPRVACFFGSFDPVVVGHVDVVKEILRRDLADRVVVLVRRKWSKKHLLARENAVSLFRIAVPPEMRNRVTFETSHLPYIRRPRGATLYVRGVRDRDDLRYERRVRRNAWIGALLSLSRPIPFVVVRSERKLRKQKISSTAARGILANPNQDLDALYFYVPEEVARILINAASRASMTTSRLDTTDQFNLAVSQLLTPAPVTPNDQFTATGA